MNLLSFCVHGPKVYITVYTKYTDKQHSLWMENTTMTTDRHFGLVYLFLYVYMYTYKQQTFNFSFSNLSNLQVA